MKSNGPILIAYDGSENAHDAIEWAGQMFGGRRTVVLYAWEPVEGIAALHGGIGSTAGTAAIEGMREADAWGYDAAEGVAAQGAELARRAGLDAKPRVAQGALPTWELIVEAADEIGASLILLGSRGRRGLRSLVLGSVSHQVSHNAHHPVLVVPTRALAQARRERSGKVADSAGAEGGA